MNCWTFELLTDLNSIFDERNLAKWHSHIDHAEDSHVFYHPALVRAWLETYRPLRHLTPIMVWARNQSGNVALLPLVLWRKNWKNAFLRSIVAIGYSDFDYHDPIFSVIPSDNERNLFWEELISLLQFKFHYDNIILDGMSRENSIEKWTKGELCPYLSLENLDSEESLFAFLKTSLRGDIRRQIRRLEEIGPLTELRFSKSEDIPTETFNNFMASHAARWPKAYKAPNFHQNLLREGIKEGVVDFSALMCGNIEIAWHLGFKHRGIYYYYMPAGNPEYRKFSPVKIHLFKLICRAIKDNFTKYDHLRGEENYKDGWSSGAVSVMSQILTSSSIESKLKHSMLKFRHLPPPRITI